MNLFQASLALLFPCFLITITVGSDNPTHFKGDVSINCGSIGTSVARNGREWLGDIQPKLSSLLQLKGLSAASTIIHELASTDPVPHKTARVSRSQFSYVLQASPGQKIIRLHFTPSLIKGFSGLKDLFTVEAGPFTLLSNFSASLTAHALGVDTFAKEFCLNIQENQQLNIFFSPESSQSLDTYAFVNGIEIISVPAGLSYFYGGDMGLHVVGQKSLVYVDNSTALEIIHRIYIRKDFVSSADDSRDIFGMWATVPKQEVNNINNITWKIPVEVGFKYLVRFHFCKIGFKMAETRGLNFKVLINEMVAVTNTDIAVKEKDDSSLPWYGDYMVVMNGHKKEGKRNLLIFLQSNAEFMDGHGPLKGFEIFKLSNPDSSLASPNPVPPAKDSPSHTIQTLLLVLGHRNAIATVAITIVSLLNIIVHALRESWEASSSEEENKPSARAERLCRRFSLSEIQLATKNFSDGLLIGRGGFGKVYKGLIDKGQKTVAIKRLKPNSQQGAHEFLTEVETLSELRHNNLVSLIGYCSEHREMILVYEYMPNGTLADHLYKLGRNGNNSSSLTWKERLNICIGAGRGIDYLHTGHGVIHRDIKGSNILLDEKKVAKVSDFGLAKHEEDGSKLQSHVSTQVKGTRGYLDAYYVNTSKLTRKSDIYAFGVVLLEVLCGRPAVDFGVSEDERLLSRWARDKISKGEVDQIVASSMREEISPNSLKTFMAVAERCLHDEPKCRPTMSQVVLQLEFAFEQQDSDQDLVLNEILSASSAEIEQSVNRVQPTTAFTDVQNLTSPPKEQSKRKMGNSGLPFEGKAAMHKKLRLWPWEAFWKRANPSKEIELLLSDHLRGMPTRFPFEELVTATNNFSKKLGEGGFGSVFEGSLNDGTKVAVKRLDGIGQIKRSFLAEVETIGSIHHINLVRLIGFCVKKSHVFLIYEYMCNGSLERWIYCRSQKTMLGWNCRRKIILDVAKGLAYLHEDCRQKIIHLDVKPQNILLDEHFNAKLADFGLSKLMDRNQIEVVTTIRGTIGYLAPEWLNSVITEKVDVYSFGVVILEILCGRKIFEQSKPEEERYLSTFFMRKYEEGQWLDCVDKCCQDVESNVAEVEKMMQISAWCLQNDYKSRPSMSMVIKILEDVVDPPYLVRKISEVNSQDLTPLLPSVLSGPR